MFDCISRGTLAVLIVALVISGCGDEDVVEVTNTVEVTGQCCDVVFKRDGAGAYVSNRSAVYEVDLGGEKLARSFSISTPDNRLADIAADGSLLLFSFSGASVATIKGGAVTGQRVIKGGAINDAVLAAGQVYATSYNDRGVYQASAQGQASPRLIKPYGQGKTSAPGYIAKTLDERTLYFTDSFNAAIHRLSTSGNKVTGTFVASNESTSHAPPIALSPMATHVVTSGVGLFVTDISDSTQIPMKIELTKGWRPLTVEFSPRDNRLVYVLASYQRSMIEPDVVPPKTNRLYAIDVSTAEVVGRSNVPLEMVAFTVSPDGQRALGAGNGNLYFLDVLLPQREQ